MALTMKSWPAPGALRKSGPAVLLKRSLTDGSRLPPPLLPAGGGFRLFALPLFRASPAAATSSASLLSSPLLSSSLLLLLLLLLPEPFSVREPTPPPEEAPALFSSLPLSAAPLSPSWSSALSPLADDELLLLESSESSLP
ncbi:unnamed protein product [Ectocarpus sp. 12 AP-2014]